MNHFPFEKAIIEKVNLPAWNSAEVEVYCKREDLIDELVSGNKWRKLKYNIDQFYLYKREKILTFGGAFSNHLHATARAGQVLGIPTIGVVRGEEPKKWSSTLKECKKMGMELYFVSRAEYKDKTEKWYHDELSQKFGSIYIIPEGGNNYYGLIGCQEILSSVNGEFSHVFCGLGTGTTFSGLITSGFEADFYGVSALKGDFHERDVKDQINAQLGNYQDHVIQSQVHFISDYHFGGFAKYTRELIEFVRHIYSETQIKLDVVYNAKVWFALNEMIKNKAILPGSKVLLIHTGGLQGNRGVEAKMDEHLF